eukprot:4202011-Prymnesium_polylepis.1
MPLTHWTGTAVRLRTGLRARHVHEPCNPYVCYTSRSPYTGFPRRAGNPWRATCRNPVGPHTDHKAVSPFWQRRREQRGSRDAPNRAHPRLPEH